jgi:hypothetical protein
VTSANVRTNDDEPRGVEALLLAILLELRALRADRARAASIDSPLGRIVTAAWSAVGSEEFTAAALLELGKAPHRPALAHALEGLSSKGLGKLLAGAEGEVVEGLRLVRVNPNRKPGRWRLCDVESRQSREAFNPWR